MGGGGGHHGGHGGHGGHHGVAASHHADQSPAWNMAMQIEKDTGRRMGWLDPRIMLGITLLGFVTLLSLPYTLDYIQSMKDAQPEPSPSQESSGPSPAALSMVGATLFGGGARLEHIMPQAEPRAEAPPPAKEEDAKDRASNDDPEKATQDGLEAAKEEVYAAPEVASQSAKDTVSQMLEASGMQRGPARAATPQSAYANLPQSTSPAYGAPQPSDAACGAMSQSAVYVPQSAPAYAAAPAGAAAPAYYNPAGQQYSVYIPNQQFGQPAPAMIPAQQVSVTGVPQQVPMASMSQQQVASVPLVPAFAGGIPRQSGDARSPFNPQTSAIVCPMGMRRRGDAPTVPMLPSSSTDGGGQRMRVWASR